MRSLKIDEFVDVYNEVSKANNSQVIGSAYAYLTGFLSAQIEMGKSVEQVNARLDETIAEFKETLFSLLAESN